MTALIKRATAVLLLALLIIPGLLLAPGCSQLEIPSGPTASAGHSIVINEVMSSNAVFWPAADGRCYDWVELRNLTDTAYDLSSCFITDNEREPRKCALTGITIEPHGYARLYLSGLDGIDTDGYLHAPFKLASAGETLFLNDADGVVMFRLDIPASPANVSYGYPPGETVFGENGCVWFSTPTPGAENSGDYAADPSQLTYVTNGVVINEYMTDNSFILYDTDGDYSDWVELYNPTGSDADMSGCFLSDDPDSIGKWRFPQGTSIPAGGYMVVFCSGKDKTDSAGYLHTSFSLGGDDVAIVLSSPQGALASRLEIMDVPRNISCGVPEGSTELKLFARPTPGRANTSASFGLDELPTPDINRGVLISETLSASAGADKLGTDYIEIHNATSEAVGLGGYTLAQSPGEVVFTFPDVTLAAGGYLLVYCDGTTAAAAGSALHAPIKLNIGGESLYLADASGSIVDYFETGKQVYGVTSGRIGGDTAQRWFFTNPTPGAANSGERYASYAPVPVFSAESGYCESGKEISITVPEGCTVRYTVDGTEPTGSSPVYTEGSPVTVAKTTVLRAKCYRADSLASQTVTATYLVEQPHDISVVSLSGEGLTDFYTGILIEGYYNNYRQGWVRDVHIEYFDESGAPGVEFEAGAEIFGQYSRSLPQKGIRLNLSERYGAPEVTYPFFPDTVTGVSSFRSILLRPCGQDYNRAKLRDELVPAIIRGRVEVDYQEFRACALYVNGEYWGLYYIRERLDEDYLVSKYGFEKGKTDLIKSQLFEQAGTIDAYIEVQNYARNHDLTNQTHYEYMCSQIDLLSLCDYWIIETYFANTDTGNIRCYKTEGGKWRWMVYDFDWAMTGSTYQRNFINNHLLDPSGHGSANFSNAIIRKLLQNKEFRELFISRYCYHLNTTFATERVLGILDPMTEVIRSEIPRQTAKWGEPTDEIWQSNLEFLRKFFTVKPDMAKEQLKASFGLSQAELDKYLADNK